MIGCLLYDMNSILSVCPILKASPSISKSQRRSAPNTAFWHAGTPNHSYTNTLVTSFSNGWLKVKWTMKVKCQWQRILFQNKLFNSLNSKRHEVPYSFGYLKEERNQISKVLIIIKAKTTNINLFDLGLKR